jgi:hypothetical protein
MQGRNFLYIASLREAVRPSLRDGLTASRESPTVTDTFCDFFERKMNSDVSIAQRCDGQTDGRIIDQVQGEPKRRFRIMQLWSYVG